MLGIKEEISVFLQALLAGGIVFWIYDCLRIARRLVKHNLFLISVEDFLFWIGTGVYLFIEIYHTSDGSIRWFFVIGVMGGVFLSYLMTAAAKQLYKKFHEKKID